MAGLVVAVVKNHEYMVWSLSHGHIPALAAMTVSTSPLSAYKSRALHPPNPC